MEGESGRGFDGLTRGEGGVKGEASESCGWWGTKESGCTASREEGEVRAEEGGGEQRRGEGALGVSFLASVVWCDVM
jgi:hypothetical protein